MLTGGMYGANRKTVRLLVVRSVGELFVTAGLVLLLFVTYQLFWTNFEAHRAQGAVTDQIRDAWDRPVVAAKDNTGDLRAVLDRGAGPKGLNVVVRWLRHGRVMKRRVC